MLRHRVSQTQEKQSAQGAASLQTKAFFMSLNDKEGL